MKHLIRWGALSLSWYVAAPGAASAERPAPSTEEAPPSALGELYELGRSLFDSYAPEAVREHIAFPTRQEWDRFAAELQRAMESESLAEIAQYELEARAALEALRLIPEYQDYIDWLKERLDYIEAAGEATEVPPPSPPRPPPPTTPTRPRRPASSVDPAIPHYDLWLARLRQRPRPAQADTWLADLKKVFLAEGLPAELVWLAETESTFNPLARSPVGARGLFQLMPATAQELGLSLQPIDERTDPHKSARAAARFLRSLHGRFASWPLALAAYNAGPGRVGRTLKAQNANSFAEIAAVLPAETRMYVPKVFATLAVREGVTPGQLAAPQPLPPGWK